MENTLTFSADPGKDLDFLRGENNFYKCNTFYSKLIIVQQFTQYMNKT